MTGFGAGRAAGPSGAVNVQVASVNHRYLQVQVRSDLRDLAVEEAARRRTSEVLQRGAVTVQITFRPAADAAFDVEALRRSWLTLSTLAAELGAPTPTLEGAARLTTTTGALTGTSLIEQALDQALDACQAMRRSEGARLAEALGGLQGRLVALRGHMVSAAAGRVEGYHHRLCERLTELLHAQAGLDPASLVRELAVYSERIDIAEELTRLESHLAQFTALLGRPAEEQVGKPLDFLLQEIGREVNTAAAKANDATLQGLAVEAKTLVEQLREQAANVL